MVDELVAAREFLERIRFSGDTLRYGSDGNSAPTDAIAGAFFHNELEISPEITPALAAQLELVCERLRIPKTVVRAFVYASPELQGDCYATSTASCVVRFSSGLVDLLDAHEFSFVCGHELGHFLLGHGITRLESRDLSLEYFMQQRAQEISVDRAGLVACNSLEVAIRALMKTASGLNNKHLRFDVGKFIAQLEKASMLGSKPEYMATHPSILVRCRALLWFSMNGCNAFRNGSLAQEGLASLDARIEGDLQKYVDGPARKKIEEAKTDLALWMAVYEIVQYGVFDKTKQEAFAKQFGLDVLERTINFLQEISKSEVEDIVYQRVKDSREALESLVPSSFEFEVKEIQSHIGEKFG